MSEAENSIPLWNQEEKKLTLVYTEHSSQWWEIHPNAAAAAAAAFFL